MKRTLKYEIATEYDGFQIDKYLKAQGYSSANITAIKKMPNNVVIDDEWVHMNYKLKAGEIFREKTEDLLKNKDYLTSILRDGADRASHTAYRTLRKVYKKVGFVER